MSDSFAIIVTVKLKPGTADEFRPLIVKNAETTVREDPNCKQFQVLADHDDPDTFHYYEVYTDEAALAAHREHQHVRDFFAATNHMVQEKTVRRCAPLTG